MSNEVSKQPNTFGTNVLNYGVVPAIYTAVPAGIALKRHGKNVLKVQNKDGFNKLNQTMKNQGYDYFSRTQALEKGYDHYKDLATAKAKATKKFKKYQKLSSAKDLPLSKKIYNFFHKNKKITFEEYQKSLIDKYGVTFDELHKVKSTKALEKADDALKLADNALDNAGKNFTLKNAKAMDSAFNPAKDGKEVTKYLGNFEDAFNFKKLGKEITDTGVKATLKHQARGAYGYFKNNMKNELKFKYGWFNYAATALEFIPNVFNDVIPAFKEEGFWGGIKATGKTLARAGADLVGYAFGGSVGRMIGGAIGAFICPFKATGAKVGGMIGDMLFSMIIGGKVTSTVDKLVGVDEAQENTTQDNTTQENNTQDNTIVQNEIAQQNIQKTTELENNTTKNNTIPKTIVNENNLSAEQIKKIAYAKARQGINPNFKGLNSYLA